MGKFWVSIENLWNWLEILRITSESSVEGEIPRQHNLYLNYSLKIYTITKNIISFFKHLNYYNIFLYFFIVNKNPQSSTNFGYWYYHWLLPESYSKSTESG